MSHGVRRFKKLRARADALLETGPSLQEDAAKNRRAVDEAGASYMKAHTGLSQAVKGVEKQAKKLAPAQKKAAAEMERAQRDEHARIAAALSTTHEAVGEGFTLVSQGVVGVDGKVEVIRKDHAVAREIAVERSNDLLEQGNKTLVEQSSITRNCVEIQSSLREEYTAVSAQLQRRQDRERAMGTLSRALHDAGRGFRPGASSWEAIRWAMSRLIEDEGTASRVDDALAALEHGDAPDGRAMEGAGDELIFLTDLEQSWRTARLDDFLTRPHSRQAGRLDNGAIQHLFRRAP